VIAYADIDRARTVFLWGPQPKPGGKGAPKKQQKNKTPKPSGSPQQSSDSKKESS
jgi:hypothetical protein